MQTADGCNLVPISIKNQHGKVIKEMEPIRFGDEQRYLKYASPNVSVITEGWQRCHDCNVKRGEYHHPGCDEEECPNCRLQMISCGGDCGAQPC
jgi:hypothetical protein